MRLILASTSPARRMVLRSAGIDPEAIGPGVDEEAAVAAEEARIGRPLEADETVILLARLKAQAVAAQLRAEGRTEGLVFGGDSAFAQGGVVYGKPHTVAVARERWLAQRGGTGILHSGHWVIDLAAAPAADGTGSEDADGVGEVSQALVEFEADIDDAELDWYLASGEPLEVAGAFTLDSLGQAFIRSIQGDPGTVIGLSVPVLRRLVRRLGGSWPAVVASNPLP